MIRTNPNALKQYMQYGEGWRDTWHKWLDSNLKARMIVERRVLMDIHLQGWVAGLRSLDGRSE